MWSLCKSLKLFSFSLSRDFGFFYHTHVVKKISFDTKVLQIHYNSTNFKISALRIIILPWIIKNPKFILDLSLKLFLTPLKIIYFFNWNFHSDTKYLFTYLWKYFVRKIKTVFKHCVKKWGVTLNNKFIYILQLSHSWSIEKRGKFSDGKLNKYLYILFQFRSYSYFVFYIFITIYISFFFVFCILYNYIFVFIIIYLFITVIINFL